jgi:nitroreductase
MLLAAEALGYAACWVQGGLDVGNGTEVIKLPDRYRALIMICLGRAAAADARREKRPLADMLHWQAFGGRD